MNNLHRELAPISDAAWADLEEETTRTLKRYSRAARGNVRGPGGVGLSAVAPATQDDRGAGDAFRETARVRALVELRVPFELDRQQIDDVERGAGDSDWQPAKTPRKRSPMPRTAPSSRAIPRRASAASGRYQHPS